MAAQAVILKSETYNFQRLDLTRQVGFIVTIYDEDGPRLATTMPFSTPAEAFGDARKIVDNKVEGPKITRCIAGGSGRSPRGCRSIRMIAAMRRAVSRRWRILRRRGSASRDPQVQSLGALCAKFSAAALGLAATYQRAADQMEPPVAIDSMKPR